MDSSKTFLIKMRQRVINECRKQFPECPEEIDDSCKVCPFYKSAKKK